MLYVLSHFFCFFFYKSSKIRSRIGNMMWMISHLSRVRRVERISPLSLQRNGWWCVYHPKVPGPPLIPFGPPLIVDVIHPPLFFGRGAFVGHIDTCVCAHGRKREAQSVISSADIKSPCGNRLDYTRGLLLKKAD